MANGIVRQLITRLSFVVDTKVLNGFKRTVEGIKKGLNSFVSGFKSFAASASSLALTVAGLITSASAFAGYLGNTERKLQGLARLSGVGRDQLEKLRYAFNSVGISTETFQGIIGKLGVGLSQAKLGYGPLLEFSSQIGLNLQKSNGEFKTTDELFGELIDYARQIKNPALQDLFMKMAFGDLSPAEATALLSKSAEDFKSIANSATDLQATIGAEDQKQLDEFQKNFTEMKELIFKWGTEITLAVLPSINKAISYFVRLGRQVRNLKEYFTELGAALVRIFQPIVDAIERFQNFIAPAGSKARGYLDSTKDFFGDVWHKYTHPFETADLISRNLTGVSLLNAPAPLTVNVTTTVPPGTSSEQARFIQDTSEAVYDGVGAQLERQTRQMTNNNLLMSY